MKLFLTTTMLVAACSVAATGRARAAEGMWTLDNLPTATLQSRYGFKPDAAWITHAMHASARLPLGCSASFVSPDGLVMTNHHCVAGCLDDLASPGHNLVENGFSSPRAGVAPRCPGMEINQLDAITDVTKSIDDALAGKTGPDYVTALHSTEAAIEKTCAGGDTAHLRCDVIELYHGGRYDLYKYRRFQDVRIVFAPEDQIANFGGDPDNFNYPRYDLDVSFLRAYDNGKPAHTDYFRFDPAGPKAGEFLITSGNPGMTSRENTAEQLEALRDIEVPFDWGQLNGFDGVAWTFRHMGPEQSREAQNAQFYTENALKVYAGWTKALGDPSLISDRRAADNDLLDWINADPGRKQSFGDPFAAVRNTIAAERTLFPRFTMLEGERRPMGFRSIDFMLARTLVRAAAERAKPDADRLPEFRDAKLPELQAQLFGNLPIYPALEKTTLAWSLTKLRQVLGADDPTIRTVFGRFSPEQIADRAVSGTHLADIAVRHQLWNGGEAAIQASNDPMIKLALAADPSARAVRTRWENEVEAPQAAATTAIAKARFARAGTSAPPDATFTERLSFGTVEGWTEDGKTIPPFTDFAGLYRRTTGADPFDLPKSWIEAQKRLDPNTPFDFVSSNDITGGNSGSPILDRDLHVVGVVFDGNLPSLAGDLVYRESDNRAVSVDTTAMIAALRHVYHLDWLADELIGSSTPGG